MSYKKLLTNYLFLFALFSFFGQGHTQFLQSEYYSVNNGLSFPVVTDIHQSKDGFLWVGTQTGLNKFDGYEFTVFDNLPNNPYKISQNQVEEIHEDEFGNLVLVYENKSISFDLLNPKTFELTPIKMGLTNKLKGIPRDIFVNEAGKVLVLTKIDDNLRLYQLNQDRKFDLIFDYKEKSNLPSLALDCISLENGDFLMNDDKNGLRRFKLRPNSTDVEPIVYKKSAFAQARKLSEYPNRTHFLHEDRQGRIWISFQNTPGVFVLNPGSEKIIRASEIPGDKLYTNIWEDSKGNILFAHATAAKSYFKALYCLKPDGSVQNLSEFVRVGNQVITVFSLDFSKYIFLGTTTGLQIVQNTAGKVESYLNRDPLNNTNTSPAIVKGITGDSYGNVYFAQESDYWFKLNPISNRIDTIILRDSINQLPIAFNRAMNLILEQDSLLWGIATSPKQEALLMRYDLNSDSTTVFTFEKPNHLFNAFCRGKDGQFWIAAYSEDTDKGGKLYQFDPQQPGFQEFKLQGAENPLKDIIPTYLLRSQNGVLWLGSNNGLFKINTSSGQVSVYNVQPEGSKKGLSSGNIIVLHEHHEDTLLVGTLDGLNVFDPNQETVLGYFNSREHGLASDYICGILPQGDGDFWITTFDGISYYDHDNVKNQFRSFDQGNGFSQDVFNPFAFYKAPDGTCYVGGMNGISAFQSSDVLTEEELPMVLITKFSRYNSSMDRVLVEQDKINYVDEITISPSDTYFELSFALPVYDRPRKNQFKVLLEGYDKNWVYLGTNNLKRYDNLPAKTYKLRIWGADPSGNWGDKVKTLTIKVQRPFYQKWWFYLSIIAFVAAVLYIFLHYRLEQRLKVERLRMKISSDLHDELSGLLSGIAMQTDVLQILIRDTSSKDKIKKIGEVSRKAMSKMSDVIWSIDSRKDKVEDLIQRMREHADDILIPISIKYDLIVGKIEPSRKMPVNIRQNLYFIYKEAINNIAKHSKATYVLIRVGNTGSNFELIVQDNGIGIVTDKFPPIKKGQGLSNLKMRAQRIDANLTISKAKGYTIHLIMKKFA